MLDTHFYKAKLTKTQALGSKAKFTADSFLIK